MVLRNVAGVHKFTVSFNLWTVLGHNGGVVGEAVRPQSGLRLLHSFSHF